VGCGGYGGAQAGWRAGRISLWPEPSDPTGVRSSQICELRLGDQPSCAGDAAQLKLSVCASYVTVCAVPLASWFRPASPGAILCFGASWLKVGSGASTLLPLHTRVATAPRATAALGFRKHQKICIGNITKWMYRRFVLHHLKRLRDSWEHADASAGCSEMSIGNASHESTPPPTSQKPVR
jgi:hypothetical protein